ncbi:MAG: hypothetical protein JW984_07165 [Deltaproteobacteria bacterium]|uniref:Uncharacterized protein n=1 Tax=Candidatus Zymogenus saltonus TaxID=2844893 RepID=A0A9D8PNZ9_9DELT|nr:hypothetical protein [Candidatus Zymogenus saltonus]
MKKDRGKLRSTFKERAADIVSENRKEDNNINNEEETAEDILNDREIV